MRPEPDPFPLCDNCGSRTGLPGVVEVPVESPDGVVTHNELWCEDCIRERDA